MAKKAKKRTRAAKNKRSYKLNLKKGTKQAIVQLIFFSLALLSIISFARRGLILVSVNDLLTSLFDWTAVFVPFVFFSFGLLVSKFKTPLGSPNTVVGGLLFFVSVMSVFRAGSVGARIWDGISALITPAGSVVLFLASFIVGLVILFNTSLDQVYFVVVKMLKNFKTYIISDKKLLSLNKPKIKNQKHEIKFTGVGVDDAPRVNDPEVLPVSAPASVLTTEQLRQADKDSGTGLIKNQPGEGTIWKYPSIDLLKDEHSGKANRGDVSGNAKIIEETLESFGINAKVVEVSYGPAVTQYAIQVAVGTKLSRITNLERDLALALAAPTGSIRIEAPIPGRSLVGIELPNISPEFVSIKKILASPELKNHPSKIALAMGIDVTGAPVVADLARMPHLLVAGQTGSGKSISINSFLATMLYRASPSEVKFILVDPKRVELTGYNDIPHLLTPVIVEHDQVASALRWLTKQMDSRYEQFSQMGVKDINSFNESHGYQALPHIVLVIDEMADIMLAAPTEIESYITRLGQKSRAAGIHMILATQRPSVNIITGLIKANVPSRVAFKVASQVDSRVILDAQGAEKLLGRGDMLLLQPDKAKPVRVQGAFVSEKEVREIVSFIKSQGIDPQYIDEITAKYDTDSAGGNGAQKRDDKFMEAARAIVEYNQPPSVSYLQRVLGVGYARAARLMDQLVEAGIVSPPNSSQKREVLMRDLSQLQGDSSQSQSL